MCEGARAGVYPSVRACGVCVCVRARVCVRVRARVCEDGRVGVRARVHFFAFFYIR